MSKQNSERDENQHEEDRRSFLSKASSLAMVGGLAAGYGTFAYMGGRFLYPETGRTTAWLFVTEAGEILAGDAFSFRLPSGETVTVRRREQGEEIVALSSVCPHLGCQVHWEPQNARFFCPCHNGAFDAEGNPTEGPPAEAGQALGEYPIEIRNGLVFIEVPVDGVAG